MFGFFCLVSDFVSCEAMAMLRDYCVITGRGASHQKSPKPHYVRFFLFGLRLRFMRGHGNVTGLLRDHRKGSFTPKITQTSLCSVFFVWSPTSFHERPWQCCGITP